MLRTSRPFARPPMFRVFPSLIATAALLLTLLALPLLYRIPNPLNNPLLNEVHDLSHTGLFFLIEMLLLIFLHHRWPLRPVSVLLVATLISLSAGAGIEWVQPMFDRNSSRLDMLRNLLGIIAAICAWLAAQAYLGKTWRAALATSAIGTMIIAGAGVYPWLIAQYTRDRSFPVIMDFSERSLYRYVDSAAQGELEITPSPGPHVHKGQVARLFMPGNAQWPGMSVTALYPDWSDYRKLKFDVYHSGTSEASLGLNIYSAQSKRNPWGYKAFRLESGHNHLEFELPATKPDSRDDITNLLIYSKSKGTDLTVYIDNIWLE